MASHPDCATPIDRRQFVVAGAAAVTLPTWAARPATGTANAKGDLPSPGQALVLSGRVCSSKGEAWAGARIEFDGPGRQAPVVWADGDGRFLLQSHTPSGPLRWRASVDGRTVGTGEVDLSTSRTTTHLDQDSQGVWRATMGLTLA